jgi:membrane associated rhomboid family serine protease
MDAITVLASKIPFPAGLLIAAGITAVGCVVFVLVQTAVRGDTIEWENALGGVVVALVLGALGLLLVLAGAPAFK